MVVKHLNYGLTQQEVDVLLLEELMFPESDTGIAFLRTPAFDCHDQYPPY